MRPKYVPQTYSAQRQIQVALGLCLNMHGLRLAYDRALIVQRLHGSGRRGQAIDVCRDALRGRGRVGGLGRCRLGRCTGRGLSDLRRVAQSSRARGGNAWLDGDICPPRVAYLGQTLRVSSEYQVLREPELLICTFHLSSFAYVAQVKVHNT